MGFSLLCALFKIFSPFLHWTLEYKSNLTCFHYLDIDDVLIAGTHALTNCQFLKNKFQDLCQLLGFNYRKEKKNQRGGLYF